MEEGEEEGTRMKCRTCRWVLLKHPQVRVEDSHGEPFESIPSPASGRTKEHCDSQVWYIPEDSMPEWIKGQLSKGGWVKGKLSCPKCEARLGSYNFVSGFKCPCGARVVPPIHVVKSKVDFTRTFICDLYQSEEVCVSPGASASSTSANNTNT